MSNNLLFWSGIVSYSYMLTLFILNESFTNGYKDIFLNSASLVAVLCGILVIITKNPIISVLFLIGLFLSVSGYLIMLGLNFIGLSYLLVYIGAVSILFLFILMLINVRISELLSNTSNSIPLAIILGILFNYPIYQILPYSIVGFYNYILNVNNTFDYF
jgi:NADH-ubiquinone oxidoreductase chain 6